MSTPPPRMSIWAAVALLVAILGFCPPLALAAPVLGVWALRDVRRHGHRGRGVAIAAIVLGLIACIGWGAAARWWHVNVRVPLREGPVVALRAGLAGDVDRFLSHFHGDGSTDAVSARAFLEEVRRRYGRAGSSQVGFDSGGDPFDPRRPIVPYIISFDSGPVSIEAQFLVFGEQGAVEPILKWTWIRVLDPDRPNLLYPPTAMVPEPLSENADDAADPDG